MKLGAIHPFLLLFTSACVTLVLGTDGQDGVGHKPQPQLILGSNPPPPQYNLETEPQPQSNPEIKADCDTIASCGVKGKNVLDLIEKSHADTPGLHEKFNKNYNNPKWLVIKQVPTVFNEPKRVKDMLKKLNIAVSQKLTQITIKGKTPGAVAYDQFYDKGLIVANHNFKAEDPVAPANQVNWNVVAFEGYKLAKFQPHDLRYVLRFEIVNKGTLAVIEEVYKKAGKKVDDPNWQRWTLAANKDSFLGLLGTPNGNGAGFILSDYAATLNHKRIVAILTLKYEREWSMLIEYS